MGPCTWLSGSIYDTDNATDFFKRVVRDLNKYRLTVNVADFRTSTWMILLFSI